MSDLMDAKDQKITAAAMRLFYRHGYRKVTMMDIAQAASMSRPSLYASFPNKEAIFTALMDEATITYAGDARVQVARAKRLQDRLDVLFDVWILHPFASAIESENGADLLANCATYAPDAYERLYLRFEEQLVEVLEPAMLRERRLSAQDLSHILVMAIKGLKASTPTLSELQRLTDGLIAMAIATAAG